MIIDDDTAVKKQIKTFTCTNKIFIRRNKESRLLQIESLGGTWEIA
jgi:hypothetical protein